MNRMDAQVYELLKALQNYFDQGYLVCGASLPFDTEETFAQRVEALLKEFRQANN